jgi:hypothetical protein
MGGYDGLNMWRVYERQEIHKEFWVKNSSESDHLQGQSRRKDITQVLWLGDG